MQELENIWPKNITVDKRIVKILSESTYENFPRALKELVTNSYDADARTVEITVDLKSEVIIIEDDGRGMDNSDFTFYLRIAGKKREKESNVTEMGRDIIGQFGVGFLSIFPFFKSYSIETKKVGSRSVVFASIPLAKYFLGDNKMIDIESIAINGGVREDKKGINKSFTRITLNGFNGLTKSFFDSKKSGSNRKNDPLNEPQGVDLLKWTLEEDLPLRFKNEKFNDVFKYKESLPFSVFVNGDRLFRNIFGNEILETHKGNSQQIGQIRFKYFIATPRKIINPRKGRYFKIRNVNVGVGERDDFGIDRGGSGSHQRWIYGEIHIIEGLNNLIKVSRDGFNYSADFEELKDYFNSKLRQYSNLLSEESRFEKDVKQTGKEFRVSDVKLLNQGNLKSKLETFRKEGYSIKHEEVSNTNKPIKIDQEKKEIIINESAKFEKSIQVQGKKYRVLAEEWDYEEDEFPACRVQGNKITINQSYPLFKSIKYTDIFVKMHLMLALNLERGSINKKTFKLLSEEILSYCKDYIK